MATSLFPGRVIGGPWLVGCSLLTMALDAALIALWFVGPQYEEFAVQFGSALPKLTSIVLANYRWAAVLLIILSVAAIALIRSRGQTLTESRWAVGAFLAASLAAAVVVAAFVIGLYLPIFTMGNVV